MTTAAILAGGLGTRLRPVISDRPKVLAPVNGRPFLAYLLNQLLEAGVRRVVLCTGYLGEQVRQIFGDRYGALSLVYSQESEPLGTGGALRLALPLLDSDPVLVMNGDSYCQVDLNAFLRWHKERRATASLLLTWVSNTGRYGRVLVNEEGIVQSFKEKGGTRGAGFINAGIYLLSREVLQSIPAHTVVSLEHQVFPSWIGRGLYGYAGGSSFLDIGTPESYAAAQRFFQHHPVFPSPCRLVILDRDGTINVEKHYLSNPDEVELLPNAAAGIRRMRELGLKVVVVTNQSAIGRGYFDHNTLERIHDRLLALLAAEGAAVDRIYVCPHRPDEGCDCRKPKPGLLEQAAREFQADLTQAFVIGDKAIDIETGRRVGATTLLVRTGYGAEVAAQGGAGADYVVDDLAEAAAVIDGLTRGQGDREKGRSGRDRP
jgi:histidinol-phosphate phosphatase family protein